jgi:hypothetical protein
MDLVADLAVRWNGLRVEYTLCYRCEKIPNKLVAVERLIASRLEMETRRHRVN